MIFTRTILELCDRFHCLPSQVMAEDAMLLKLLEIERLSTAATDSDRKG